MLTQRRDVAALLLFSDTAVDVGVTNGQNGSLARENGAHGWLELIKTRAGAERANSMGEPSPLDTHKKRATSQLVGSCLNVTETVIFFKM